MSHVLVLEPDALLAQTYGAALEHSGHSVTLCATAQGAIFAADDRQPDVVVAELQLVEHSGIEFIYEFRSYPEWQRVPVVVQTSVHPADLTASEKILRNQLGVVHVLYKPHTTLQELCNRVSQQLSLV